MRIALVLALAFGLLAMPAFGQSINIDMSGFNTPSSAFGGASGQAGYWNNFTSIPSVPTPLQGLDGALTTVTIKGTLFGGMSAFYDPPPPSGDFYDLMADGWRLVDVDDHFVFEFNGLEPGEYFLYTFADTPLTSTKDTVVGRGVELPDLGLLDPQVTGGWYASYTFVQGVTHARHYFHIEAGSHMIVTIKRNDISSAVRGVLNGFQIHKLPRRLYVDQTATGTGDGQSWQNAFTDLQDALDAVADYDTAIQEIWVADGIYYPTSDISRSASFRLINNVSIYGGFTGTETSLDQRDPQTHVTTLSGNIGGTLSFDNSFHVIDTWDNNAAAVLDGFTVMSGRADGVFGWDDKGGGIHIRDGSPTIRNCRFLLNYAEFGGGAVNIEDGAPTFVNCLFQNNLADEEGGAIRYSNMPETGTLRISHCRFLSNASYWYGGSIDVQAGQAWISNCIFTGGFASQDGGAVRVHGSGTLATLFNCSLVGNYAYRFGGGICTSSSGNATLANAILWDNSTSSQPATSFTAQLGTFSGGTYVATYSCVRGYTPVALPGAGNTGAEPLFVDADGGDGYGDLNDDLRLLPVSPLIDAGNSFATGNDITDMDGDGITIEPMPVDLDLLPRMTDFPTVPNTGLGSVPIDIGAYERQIVPAILGDMDCNGVVNLADVPAMTLALTDPAQYSQSFGCILNGDIAVDGLVNGMDLQGFVALIVQ